MTSGWHCWREGGRWKSRSILWGIWKNTLVCHIKKGKSYWDSNKLDDKTWRQWHQHSHTYWHTHTHTEDLIQPSWFSSLLRLNSGTLMMKHLPKKTWNWIKGWLRRDWWTKTSHVRHVCLLVSPPGSPWSTYTGSEQSEQQVQAFSIKDGRRLGSPVWGFSEISKSKVSEVRKGLFSSVWMWSKKCLIIGTLKCHNWSAEECESLGPFSSLKKKKKNPLLLDRNGVTLLRAGKC